jgi:Peptidase family M23
MAGFTPKPPPGGGNQTINQVFAHLGLWEWFNSQVTQAFNGVTEKGQDYSTTFGTPVGVPVGGIVKRMVQNFNSIGWVVEIMDASGAVWLYQHITATCGVGQQLNCGDVVGTENGLPRDQWSTGPHIEVRWCPPGTWSANTISWLEPWVNPASLFGTVGQQVAGATGTGLGGGFGGFAWGGFGGVPSNPLYVLSPTADVTLILWAIDQALAIVNPFIINSTDVPIQDVFVPIPIIGGSFDTGIPNPITWFSDVMSNIFNNWAASTVRLAFIVMGGVIILKVIGHFIDFGAVAGTAAHVGEAVGMIALAV